MVINKSFAEPTMWFKQRARWRSIIFSDIISGNLFAGNKEVPQRFIGENWKLKRQVNLSIANLIRWQRV